LNDLEGDALSNDMLNQASRSADVAQPAGGGVSGGLLDARAAGPGGPSFSLRNRIGRALFQLA
jgi:hypothetical protein